MVLSELGFNRPTYDELLAQQEDRAKQLFGETIDTSELSILGKLIRINVKDIDTLYQILEGVFYARFPNTAKGKNLDRLCPFVGIARNPATYARHEIKISGTPNTVIEAGTEVTTENQTVVFHLIDDYTIESSGFVTAYVDCNEAGTVGNLKGGSISYLVKPLVGVDEIVHITISKSGTDEETDTDLRERFTKAVAGAGSGTASAIKGAVMRVDGVDDCTVVENKTDTKVGNCDPYSFECVVLYDGEEVTKQNIAKAIFSKKPIGINTSGTNTVTITDEAEVTHDIKFTETKQVYITVSMTVKVNNDFEDNGIAQIKETVMDYINHTRNGEYVFASKIIAGTHNVVGVEYVEGTRVQRQDSATVTTNTQAEYDEVLRVTADNITIDTFS